MGSRDKRIGLTTTVPMEVILAAGMVPVDLNNLFVSDRSPGVMVDRATVEGFPQSSCSWLKGMFGAMMKPGAPDTVVGVVRGDCEGTSVLLEALELRGKETIPFTYPYKPDPAAMKQEIEVFCDRLGTSPEAAERCRVELLPVRRALTEIDSLCWQRNLARGMEMHLWLLSSSDMWGDPELFLRELESVIEDLRGRDPVNMREGMPFRREVRLGYIGVPPITPGIFDLAEELGARFVFAEVQRQFAMPHELAIGAGALAAQYTTYTYPYSVSGRSVDINREVHRRGIDGIVHYVQSFCHRNMEDVIFNRSIEVPAITVECDSPGDLGATARARLENFVQVLGENLS